MWDTHTCTHSGTVQGPRLWLGKVQRLLATKIHASAIKKLKKLNCNFIVPFDRFPATFVAPKLFVTVALSSHCCRALCVRLIVHVCLCLCECELLGTFSRCPPFLLGSRKPLSPSPLNIHRNRARTIRETRPHKYNQPTGSLLITAYMHSQIKYIFAHFFSTYTWWFSLPFVVHGKVVS